MEHDRVEGFPTYRREEGGWTSCAPPCGLTKRPGESLAIGTARVVCLAAFGRMLSPPGLVTRGLLSPKVYSLLICDPCVLAYSMLPCAFLFCPSGSYTEGVLH